MVTPDFRVIALPVVAPVTVRPAIMESAVMDSDEYTSRPARDVEDEVRDNVPDVTAELPAMEREPPVTVTPPAVTVIAAVGAVRPPLVMVTNPVPATCAHGACAHHRREDNARGGHSGPPGPYLEQRTCSFV